MATPACLSVLGSTVFQVLGYNYNLRGFPRVVRWSLFFSKALNITLFETIIDAYVSIVQRINSIFCAFIIFLEVVTTTNCATESGKATQTIVEVPD